ncbi:MAG: hypothetical protein HC915_09380 [Anaerolineae bacterium]|nr:hypothetical protein [Anaerolineae bacterium]
MHKQLWLWLGMLWLAGCGALGGDAQPLVVVATPDAPDAGFQTYEHPSDVFSIRVPPSWIPDQLPDDNGLRVQFTAIEGAERVVRLTIYVVNTGQPLQAEAFASAVRAYQPPPDLAAIPWRLVESETAMPDGSVRVVGVRGYPTLGPRALNIFLQPNGSYFSALEVDVTGADEATLQTLRAVANTFRVNTAAPLRQGAVFPAGVTSATGVIGFQNYLHWQDSNGGFNLTGQVVNQSEEAFEAMRLTGFLLDEAGNILAERSGILSLDVLRAGEVAPFRLRFDTGRPTTAVRYEIHAAARAADFDRNRFYGDENFIIGEEEARISEDGFLIISGLVQNNNTQLATNVKIIATILDAQGQVVAAETTFVNQETLRPGEAVPFEVTVSELGGPGFSYDLLVQGSLP